MGAGWVCLFCFIGWLGFDIELQEDCVYANGVNAQNYQLFEWHSADTLKATRRAIVRAAAEMGKAL